MRVWYMCGDGLGVQQCVHKCECVGVCAGVPCECANGGVPACLSRRAEKVCQCECISGCFECVHVFKSVFMSVCEFEFGDVAVFVSGHLNVCSLFTFACLNVCTHK